MSLFRKIFGSKSERSDDELKSNDRGKYMPEIKLPIDERFTINFKANGGKFLYCENLNEIYENLDHIIDENSWQKKFVDPMPFNPKKTLKASDKMFIETNPKKSCFNMKRPSPNNPSPTLTQMGQARGSSGVLHFSENRKLTVVECKRLMGFPEDFVLTGTFDQQVERLGRAVAPLMYKEVSKRIYETIIFPYNQSR